MKRGLAAFAIALACTGVGAESSKATTEQRMRALAEELRCLVCQNQTIADSNAPLAVDLRAQIRTQISEGRDDDQIRAYMVERYGDFVLYKPPFKASTLVLWLGPLMLLAAGLAIFWTVVKKRRAPAPAAAPQAARRAEIEALLEGSGPATKRPTAAPSGKR